MTVKELIKELEKMPHDAIVYVPHDDWLELTSVEDNNDPLHPPNGVLLR
jgi:hypothetical protein